MEPIITSKIINEYICLQCHKKSEFKTEIFKCIKKHEKDSLIKDCNSWGQQAIFKDKEQADKFVQMTSASYNESSFIPCTLTDTYSATIDWQGPGTYGYHANIVKKYQDYNEFNISFKKIR